MQAAGVALGATQTVKVPTLNVAFGVPITRDVYRPTAPGRLTVAVRAGGAHVAMPTIDAPWVTTTRAPVSAAGVCRSVKVISKSCAVAIVNVSAVAAAAPLTPTKWVSGDSGSVACACTASAGISSAAIGSHLGILSFIAISSLYPNLYL